mmetsp:Transcript_2823/g.7401  ORF Transcript_2823/g.7401 Transcript_2823/m.7401 type:complete len:271 (+) Transcript_2823:583-1395(+)
MPGAWPRVHGDRGLDAVRRAEGRAVQRLGGGGRGGGLRHGADHGGLGLGARRGGDGGVRARHPAREDHPRAVGVARRRLLRARGGGRWHDHPAAARQGRHPALRRRIHPRARLCGHIKQLRHPARARHRGVGRVRQRAARRGHRARVHPRQRARAVPEGGGAPRGELQPARALRRDDGCRRGVRGHWASRGRRDAAQDVDRLGGVRAAGCAHCERHGPAAVLAAGRRLARGPAAQAAREGGLGQARGGDDALRRHPRLGHPRGGRAERDD